MTPGGAGVEPEPSAADREVVTALLGRPPAGAYAVVVRDPAGTPAVIANAPLLGDGTPMPTRYWLVDPVLREKVARLESDGAVREAEQQVDPSVLAAAHRRYAAERDALVAGRAPRTPPDRRRGRHADGRQVPPRPSGVVARRG